MDDIKIVTINIPAHRVYVGDREVNLTPKQFEILRFLASRPNEVISRETISRHVACRSGDDNTRVIDQHITRLRKTLKQDCITTVCGYGYRFDGKVG